MLMNPTASARHSQINALGSQNFVSRAPVDKIKAEERNNSGNGFMRKAHSTGDLQSGFAPNPAMTGI